MPTQPTTMPHLADHRAGDPSDTPAIHNLEGGPCFGCWCYSCGGRTDLPRLERPDDQHPGDPSHRWCFE